MIDDRQQMRIDAIARVMPEKFGKDRRAWAYTAIQRDHHAILGVAEFGRGGYTPIEIVAFDTYHEAAQTADKLNLDRGISVDDACRIVADTMKRPAGMHHDAS